MIKRINDVLCRISNEQTQQTGISLSQMRVVTYLKDHEGEKFVQKDIEAYFGLSHPTVVGVIQRMEDRGYITCTIDRSDRRIKNLSLTEKGEKLVADAEDRRKQMEERLLSDLTRDEVAQLRALLEKLLPADSD